MHGCVDWHVVRCAYTALALWIFHRWGSTHQCNDQWFGGMPEDSAASSLSLGIESVGAVQRGFGQYMTLDRA